MTTLIAPNAYQQFVTQNATYTSDANKEIVNVAASDIDDLVASGCTVVANNTTVGVTAATYALTKNVNANIPTTISKVNGQAITLPNATGSGDEYAIVVGLTITSVGTTIKVGRAADTMLGVLLAPDTDAAGTGKMWSAAANDDTVTLDGTATGGKAGDLIIFKDVAANLWNVSGFVRQSGGSEATPFSNTVS